MNDDNFPGNRVAQASFIPYNLRAAFGSADARAHHEGVYAYYFYRLVQRARAGVDALLLRTPTTKSTGEPSRYIYQLDFESGFPVRKRVEVGVDVNLAENPTDRGGRRRRRLG